jgi:glycogen synthase
MRIAFLTPEYPLPDAPDGGLANYLKKTARMLTERGHHVSVFLSGKQNHTWQDDQVIIHEVTSDNHLISSIFRLPGIRNFSLLLRQIVRAKKLANRFWREYDKAPFDVVQVSSYATPGLFLLGNKRLPLVCRVSSYTPLWRSAYGYPSSFSENLRDWLELQQVAKANRRYAPSRFIARTFQRIEAIELDILRTPVDNRIHASDRSYFIQHRPSGSYLLFFGTLSRIKGIDLLSEIINPLLKKFPQLHLVFIGRDDGFINSVSCVQHLLNSAGMYSNRVKHLHAMPFSQLQPFIRCAEAVLMPSRIDNYPNACLEALQHGVPVIAAGDSSIEEIIEDGKSGLLFKNGDYQDLLFVVSKFLSMDQATKNTFRAAAANRAAKISIENDPGFVIVYFSETIRQFGVTS